MGRFHQKRAALNRLPDSPCAGKIRGPAQLGKPVPNSQYAGQKTGMLKGMNCFATADQQTYRMGNLFKVAAIDTGNALALLYCLFNRRIESIEIRYQPEFILMRGKPDTHQSRGI